MREKESEPRVIVDQLSRLRVPSASRWLVAWRIQNVGEGTLTILSARLPHSLFRCEERELDAILVLRPKESGRLELPVKCAEPPGTIVENAFLILRVLWSEEPWRILARLRVSINHEGAPETVTELVTTQPIGFSVLIKEKG